MEFVRESSFDKLHGFFERNVVSGSQEKMKMIRHNHKFVRKVRACVAASKDSLDK